MFVCFVCGARMCVVCGYLERACVVVVCVYLCCEVDHVCACACLFMCVCVQVDRILDASHSESTYKDTSVKITWRKEAELILRYTLHTST